MEKPGANRANPANRAIPDFTTEARAILAAEAERNGWADGVWERYVPALAARLANPRVKAVRR